MFGKNPGFKRTIDQVNQNTEAERPEKKMLPAQPANNPSEEKVSPDQADERTTIALINHLKFKLKNASEHELEGIRNELANANAHLKKLHLINQISAQKKVVDELTTNILSITLILQECHPVDNDGEMLAPLLQQLNSAQNARSIFNESLPENDTSLQPFLKALSHAESLMEKLIELMEEAEKAQENDPSTFENEIEEAYKEGMELSKILTDKHDEKLTNTYKLAKCNLSKMTSENKTQIDALYIYVNQLRKNVFSKCQENAKKLCKEFIGLENRLQIQTDAITQFNAILDELEGTIISANEVNDPAMKAMARKNSQDAFTKFNALSNAFEVTIGIKKQIVAHSNMFLFSLPEETPITLHVAPPKNTHQHNSSPR